MSGSDTDFQASEKLLQALETLPTTKWAAMSNSRGNVGEVFPTGRGELGLFLTGTCSAAIGGDW